MSGFPGRLAVLAVSAGLAFAATSSVAFAQTDSTPRRTVVDLEVIGSSGVIFDGAVVTSGQKITTPSGGTHVCDGTNNGANPKPSATPTTALDDAAERAGFTWDGEWYEEFEDFLVTRIGEDQQTKDDYWRISVNGTPIEVGGCQYALEFGDDVTFEYV